MKGKNWGFKPSLLVVHTTRLLHVVLGGVYSLRLDSFSNMSEITSKLVSLLTVKEEKTPFLPEESVGNEMTRNIDYYQSTPLSY